MNLSITRASLCSFYTIMLLLLPGAQPAEAATVQVAVGDGGPFFFPDNVTIQPGDTVQWIWTAAEMGHSVTSGNPGQSDGLFESGVHSGNYTFSYTFQNPGTYRYYCRPHEFIGMEGVVRVAQSPPGAAQPLNISTRMRVQVGDNVMIGGFIITGTDPKRVIIRAIGPSLINFGITDALADPTLELRGSQGELLSSNNNWRDTQEAEILATTIAPTNNFESAIVATLQPGAHTAIVRGVSDGTGIGLVEVYDLTSGAQAQLANISTRGFVETGSNVMIGGFILGNRSGPARLIIRGIGPSLAQFGINNALPDSTLELRDSNGALVRSNDNWRETQEAEILAAGLAPQNNLEAAIAATLSPAAYTAIVAGKNGITGVALVEVYQIP